jgi:hypothetical protein
MVDMHTGGVVMHDALQGCCGGETSLSGIW